MISNGLLKGVTAKHTTPNSTFLIHFGTDGKEATESEDTSPL
jgi:hypothetical protein